MAASRGEHAYCPPGMLLNQRYKVVKECGCGNFSKVFECIDTKDGNTPVAVKLLKKEYASDAAFEKDILVALNERDKTGAKKVARLREYFVHNRHPTFVFPLRGCSLRGCKLGVTRGNVTPEEMRQFALEMIETMRFLHVDARLVHTDLKPENILLDRTPGKDEKGIGSSWTICDFGSASFLRRDRLDSDLISTRPYRAPEVVMGNGWHTAADIWSLACVMFEVQAGSRLFEVHDDAEHLHAFESRLKKLPSSVTKTSKNSPKFFGPDGSHRRPNPKAIRPMAEVLRDSPELLDLLTQMLDYDPDRRISADEALKHPYFQSTRKGPSPIRPAAEQEPLPKKYNPSPAAIEVASARPLRERSTSLENAGPSGKMEGKPPMPVDKRFVGAPTAVAAARELVKAKAIVAAPQVSNIALAPAAGKPSYGARPMAGVRWH